MVNHDVNAIVLKKKYSCCYISGDAASNLYKNLCFFFFSSCSAQAYPQERSIKKNPIVKYISGGILLVIIIFIIWFPLVFFSFFNAVFISNPPTEATLNIGIGGYQPLFRTTALGESIRKLTDAEFNSLKSFYSRDRVKFFKFFKIQLLFIILIERKFMPSERLS